MNIVVRNNVTNLQIGDSAAARADRLLAEAAAAIATGIVPTTTGIIRATNIAALRTNTPVNDQIAIVSGYYANGDGGGGEFYGVTGGSFTDDGALTIVPGGGTGTTAWKRIVQNSVNVKWFGAKCDGVTDDAAAFQAAADAINAAGGGQIDVPAGTSVMGSMVTYYSNTKLRGAGAGVTTLKKTGTGDAAIHAAGSSGNNVIDLEVSDLTVDVNSIYAGIYMEYVTRFAVRRVNIINAPLWGILVGVTSNVVSEMVNDDVMIEDVYIEGMQSTLEGIVVFNSKNVIINRVHINGGSNAPGIGIYQNLDNIYISNCLMENLAVGIYYTQSTNNITIDGCQFYNNIFGIQGANQSDNGTFGATVVRNLNVVNSYFEANTDTAMQVGAVDNFTIHNSTFYKNVNNALVFSNGNATGPGPDPNYLATNGKISDTTFLNNNTSGTFYSLHPAIYFANIGGALNLTMTNVQIYDDQDTHTQLSAMSFVVEAYSNITIFGGQLAAYDGGSSIVASAGATLSNVDTWGVMNLGGTSTGVTVH